MSDNYKYGGQFSGDDPNHLYSYNDNATAFAFGSAMFVSGDQTRGWQEATEGQQQSSIVMIKEMAAKERLLRPNGAPCSMAGNIRSTNNSISVYGNYNVNYKSVTKTISLGSASQGGAVG